MKEERLQKLNRAEITKGPVIYWMSRDQRVNDNWALLKAQSTAIKLKSPIIVVFCLVPDFLGAGLRQYSFLLRGLKQLEEDLKKKNIPFCFIIGRPEIEIPKFAAKHKAGLLITDFDPLRIKKLWKDRIKKYLKIPFYEIDAHNIVPCRHASGKQEYGAYTIRPKINRMLDNFLDALPAFKKHPFHIKLKSGTPGLKNILSRLKLNTDAPEISWLSPGEKSAKKVLRYFINNKLNNYPQNRNDPSIDGQSCLSPYLHFGQISAQRVAIEVLRSNAA